MLYKNTNQSCSSSNQLIQMGFDTIAHRQYVLAMFMPGVRTVCKVLRAFHDRIHSAQYRFLFAQDERQSADIQARDIVNFEADNCCCKE